MSAHNLTQSADVAGSSFSKERSFLGDLSSQQLSLYFDYCNKLTSIAVNKIATVIGEIERSPDLLKDKEINNYFKNLKTQQAGLVKVFSEIDSTNADKVKQILKFGEFTGTFSNSINNLVDTTPVIEAIQSAKNSNYLTTFAIQLLKLRLSKYASLDAEQDLPEAKGIKEFLAGKVPSKFAQIVSHSKYALLTPATPRIVAARPPIYGSSRPATGSGWGIAAAAALTIGEVALSFPSIKKPITNWIDQKFPDLIPVPLLLPKPVEGIITSRTTPLFDQTKVFNPNISDSKLPRVGSKEEFPPTQFEINPLSLPDTDPRKHSLELKRRTISVQKVTGGLFSAQSSVEGGGQTDGPGGVNVKDIDRLIDLRVRVVGSVGRPSDLEVASVLVDFAKQIQSASPSILAAIRNLANDTTNPVDRQLFRAMAAVTEIELATEHFLHGEFAKGQEMLEKTRVKLRLLPKGKDTANQFAALYHDALYQMKLIVLSLSTIPQEGKDAFSRSVEELLSDYSPSKKEKALAVQNISDTIFDAAKGGLLTPEQLETTVHNALNLTPLDPTINEFQKFVVSSKLQVLIERFYENGQDVDKLVEVTRSFIQEIKDPALADSAKHSFNLTVRKVDYQERLGINPFDQLQGVSASEFTINHQVDHFPDNLKVRAEALLSAGIRKIESGENGNLFVLRAYNIWKSPRLMESEFSSPFDKFSPTRIVADKFGERARRLCDSIETNLPKIHRLLKYAEQFIDTQSSKDSKSIVLESKKEIFSSWLEVAESLPVGASSERAAAFKNAREFSEIYEKSQVWNSPISPRMNLIWSHAKIGFRNWVLGNSKEALQNFEASYLLFYNKSKNDLFFNEYLNTILVAATKLLFVNPAASQERITKPRSEPHP